MSIRVNSKQARELGLTTAAPKQNKKPECKIADCQWAAYGIRRLPQKEFRFHKERRWKFDYAWPDYVFYDQEGQRREGQVALEVEGIGGRHQFTKGFIDDMEKYREAAIMGWCVIRVTTREVESGAAFALVKRALEAL